MSFWSRFEEFFMKWFAGPGRDPSVMREYARTVGAENDEKPRPMRNMSRFGTGIMDWVSALDTIRETYSHENHYLCIRFYDAEKRLVGYRYIYLDFDCEEDIEAARREADELVRYLRDRFGADAVVYFSGRKGYGVVIPLDRYVDWSIYEKLAKIVVQPFAFRTLDWKVVDANRIQRIPYTYNIKKGHRGFVYIVDRRFKRIRMEDFDWGNYEPLRIDQVRDLLVSVSGFSVPRPKRVVLYGKKELKPLPDDPAELDKCDAVPPCIRNIIQALKSSGDPDHYQRLVLVWYLKWVGYTKEQVLELFRRYASDFDENKSRYQIEYAYGERGNHVDWLAPRCSWMKERGLCLDCGWNRNIVTYTYVRAYVPEEIKNRFFERVKGYQSVYS